MLKYKLLTLPHLSFEAMCAAIDVRCQECQRRSASMKGYCGRCYDRYEVVDPWTADPLWLALHIETGD